MSDKKISQLTSLAQGDIASTTDVLAIVDTSATETKKATPAAIVGAAAAAGLTNVDINSGAIDGTAIGANSASTGAFTTLSASSSVTLSGGTANGVLYLDGSKVATSGSALTFDGATLANINSDGTGFSTQSAASNFSIMRFGTDSVNGYAFFQSGKSGTGTTLPFAWRQDSSELMRLNSTGLGIGTSSPAVPLDVVSNSGSNGINIRARSSNDYGFLNFKSNDGSDTAGSIAALRAGVNSGSLLFYTGTTEKARLDTSGNLGIGTSSPGYKLTVQQAIDTYAFNIRDTIGNERILIGSRSTAPIDNITPVQMGNDNSGNLFLSSRTNIASGINFYTSAGTTASLRATLDSSGNLGLGTSSPSDILTLAGGASGSYGLTINNAKVGGGTKAIFQYDATNAIALVGGNTTNGLAFQTLTGGSLTTKATIDSSGNLGLGVTPSAWSGGKWMQFVSTTAVGQQGNGTANLMCNAYESSGNNFNYIASVGAARYNVQAGTHAWFTAPSGTAGNAISFTQAMTLTAAGALGLGTTSPNRTGFDANAQVLTVYGPNRGFLELGSASPINSDTLGGIEFLSSTTNKGYLRCLLDGSANGILTFATNNTERARITAGGDLLVGTTSAAASSAHNIWTGTSSVTTLYIRNTNNSTPNGVVINYSVADPNGTANEFLYCQAGGSLRASIRSNGGLANYQSNNVDLSDARTKKDITPAASMWDKIGALEIVTYKYNDQTHDDVNVGVIAQQVESVEPVWVDADGFGETPEGEEPLKTVYTKDITFAAIKALQEAMARIEKLEAEMAALKGV